MAQPLNNGAHKDRPKWDGDALRQMLQQYDRRPFLDLLAEWLECSPSPEAILKFSEKYPDRYAGAIRQIAQIGGFTDRKEVSVDIYLNVRDLSDSQLEDKVLQLTKELDIPALFEIIESPPKKEEKP